MNSTRRSLPIPLQVNQEVTARDEDLLRAARAGSHSAFTELQNIHSRQLFGRILSITKNREDAEDALQETFFCAYRALPSFEGRSKFSTWLTRIAVNSALMILRKRRPRQDVLIEPFSTDEDGPSLDFRDDGLSPEQLCDQHQRCEAVLSAIQRLDPILRNAMSIRVSQGKTVHEIAHRLGISSAAAKTRLHRARQRLAQSQPFRQHSAKVKHSNRFGSMGRNEVQNRSTELV